MPSSAAMWRCERAPSLSTKLNRPRTIFSFSCSGFSNRSTPCPSSVTGCYCVQPVNVKPHVHDLNAIKALLLLVILRSNTKPVVEQPFEVALALRRLAGQAVTHQSRLLRFSCFGSDG